MSLHTAGLQASSIHVHPYTGVLTGRKRVRTWCYIWGWEVHDADAPQEAFNEFFMCGVYVCGVFCMWAARRGSLCVHLAYCIIKAQKLEHRKRKRSLR